MVKTQAPGRGRTKADRTLIYRLFVDHHMGQQQIARRLGITHQAVLKQKKKLLDAGYIKEIGNSGVYERGPNAKFYEQAEPIRPEVKEPEVTSDVERLPTRHGGAVEGGPSSASPSGLHDQEAEVPVIAAHIHNGCFTFNIEKLGRKATYFLPDGNGGRKEVPFLKENVHGYHNLWQYDGEISLPGEDWTAHLQLQVYTPKKKPSHSHLKISGLRVPLTLPEAELGKEVPFQFFENKVFAILDHLEKYAEFRFAREEGQRYGKGDGKVVYAYQLPEEVKKIIPPNLHKIEGIDDVEFDQSPGRGKNEIESEKIERLAAMVGAKERFESVRAELDRIASEALTKFDEVEVKIQNGEKGLDNYKAKVLKRFLEIYRLMDQLSEAQETMAKAQYAGFQLTASAMSGDRAGATAGLDEEKEKDPKKKEDNGVMYA